MPASIKIFPWLLARVPRSYKLVKSIQGPRATRSLLTQTGDEIGEFRHGAVSDGDRIPDSSISPIIHHLFIQSFCPRSYALPSSFVDISQLLPVAQLQQPGGGPTTLELPPPPHPPPEFPVIVAVNVAVNDQESG